MEIGFVKKPSLLLDHSSALFTLEYMVGVIMENGIGGGGGGEENNLAMRLTLTSPSKRLEASQ